MALRIRFSKVGRKNRPSYRIVVSRKRVHQKGNTLEFLGFFDPYSRVKTKINRERLSYWEENGAVVAEGVKKILNDEYRFEIYRPKTKASNS